MPVAIQLAWSALLCSVALACSGAPRVHLSDRPAVHDGDEPSVLRVMSFNIARGAGEIAFAPGVDIEHFPHNLGEIAALLQRERPDIVAMQEVDTTSPWTAEFDNLIFMGNRSDFHHAFLGLHVVINWFGLTDPKMWGGTALMSRWPLENRYSRAFKIDLLDTAGYVVATVSPQRLDGVEIDVVSVHLNPGIAAHRLRQVEVMAEDLEARGRPLIVMGDMNNGSGDAPIAALERALGLRRYRPGAALGTFPSHEPHWRLDWILISEELEFLSHHTLPERLADHRPVMARVRVRR